MGLAVDVPDGNRLITPQRFYDWIYNSGSYGRVASEGELREKGWGRYIDNGRIYWDTTNKDWRVNANFERDIPCNTLSTWQKELPGFAAWVHTHGLDAALITENFRTARFKDVDAYAEDNWLPAYAAQPIRMN